MQVVRDLIGGSSPSPIEMYYNGDIAADSVTKRYKGSIVKLMDFDDVDYGNGFATFGLVATAMENVVGILEEDQGVTGNYLPEDATYGMQVRKITPCFPSTVVMAEYAQAGPDGTSLTDTGAACTAASKAFTLDSDTADEWIGGWVYMIDGAAAGELHYILDSTADTSSTFATAATNAIATADTFLAIGKANCREVLFDSATGTSLTSTMLYDTHIHRVTGIMHYIKDTGIPFQRLDRNLHDGLVLNNPKFYHTFTLSALNAWANGIAAA